MKIDEWCDVIVDVDNMLYLDFVRRYNDNIDSWVCSFFIKIDPEIREMKLKEYGAKNKSNGRYFFETFKEAELFIEEVIDPIIVMRTLCKY